MTEDFCYPEEQVPHQDKSIPQLRYFFTQQIMYGAWRAAHRTVLVPLSYGINFLLLLEIQLVSFLLKKVLQTHLFSVHM